MWKYISRRLLHVIPVLFLVSLALFAVLIQMPGDPLDQLVLANPEITQEDIANLRRIYGLDQPFHMRYLRWLRSVILEGDLGYSRQYRVPVTELIARNLPRTLYLSGLSFFLALIFSIPIGIYSALRQYSIGDYIWTGFAFFGYSIPNHWLGLLLIYLFAVHLGWLPAGGFRSLVQEPGFWSVLSDRMRHLILPALSLSISSMTMWMRFMRSSMLEVIREDYIRTARAKGLAEKVVIFKHGLRNSILPIITLIMLSIPFIFGGATVTEAVFAFPGMGRLFVRSLTNHDTFVTMAVILFISLLVIVCNFLADILYALVDPRIRYD